MIKFLSQNALEDAAESFLEHYHSDRLLPIPVEEILDLKLGINIIPVQGLFNQHHIDAFFSSDLTGLYIDADHLEHRYNRARYSLAHEVGHLILHGDYFAKHKMASLEIWKEVVLGKGTSHMILETQANMFASYLLMPKVQLELEFKKITEALQSDSFFSQAEFLSDNMALATYAAGRIGQVFDVSEEAAQYRLMNWVSRR